MDTSNAAVAAAGGSPLFPRSTPPPPVWPGRTRAWPPRWSTPCSRWAARSGTAALSTLALTATATYLGAHHAGPLAPAAAAVHGYSVAFTVSAALFGVAALVAALLLPSRRRMQELWDTPLTDSADSVGNAVAASPAPAPARAAEEVAQVAVSADPA